MAEPPPLSELSSLTGLPPELFTSEVFKRYSRRLLEVAEMRLNHDLRSKVSPEDVVQSVFKSFIRRVHEFRFDDDAPALWGLLVIITVRKCHKWDDQFRSEKRAVHREVCDWSASPNGGIAGEIATREPGPSEAAVVSDLIRNLMNEFQPRQQQMIALRMEGYELCEIADKLQSSRRTVARVIARAKAITTRLLDDADESEPSEPDPRA